MKFVLKILFAPIIAVLALSAWLLGAILQLSAWVFALAGTLFAALGILIFFVDNRMNGVFVLIAAFLVSPFGLPMLAAWLIGQIQALRFWLSECVYG